MAVRSKSIATVFFGLSLILVLFAATAGRATPQETPNTTIALHPVADTYVASGRPEQRRPDLGVIWVGYDEATGFQIQRSLLKFDLSAIPPDSTVVSATLSLYLAGTTPDDDPMTVAAYRLLGDFAEDINWNEHLALPIDPARPATTAVGTDLTWHQWNVREMVRAWRADPNRTPFLGMRLDGDETPGQHERSFWSTECPELECGVPPGLRPVLEIAYSIPTPTPTATPTNTPTPTLTPTPTPGVRTLDLESEPSGVIQPDEALTYTLSYANGAFPLESAVISLSVQSGLQPLVVSNGGTVITQTMAVTQANPPFVVNWPRGALDPGATGAVFARVQNVDVPTDTVISTVGSIAWQFNGQPDRLFSNTALNNSRNALYIPVAQNGNGIPIFTNWNFEQGSGVGWTEISPNFDDQVTPRSGAWVAWLGGAPGERSVLSQELAIPGERQRLALSYYTWVASVDENCGADQMFAVANDSTLLVENLCVETNAEEWTRRCVDISPFIGERVRFQFVAQLDTVGNSNLFIDDIVIVESCQE